MLAARGAVAKCSSMAWNPESMSAKPSRPIATINENPTAES